MKVLFLPAYFYPERVASSYLWDNLRESLANDGNKMELYTPMPTRGISQSVRETFKDKKTELYYYGKLAVYRFDMMQEGKNPFLRVIRYLYCNLKHYYYGIKAKNIDVLFVASTPPTQGLIAALVKKKLKIPFVYCLQDIFPDSLVGTGLTKKNSLIWKIGRKIEDYTYRHADKIIVISEDFKRNIIEKGVPKEKIEVIYNWVDESAVTSVDLKDNVLFERYNLPRDQFYVTYCGNIGLTQNFDLLLDVVKEFNSDPSLAIHFVIIGDGVYKPNAERIAKEYNLNNITFLPFQPYEDIASVFSLGDVGLVISKPGVGENSVPSKSWSILSAARPLIANFDENQLKEIVSEHNCGIFTKAGDLNALKDAVLLLYRDRNLCKEMGQNGRRFIEANLTRKVGVSKYIDVFENVLNIK